MAKNKYTYNTFKELFDEEIHYAYEGQYGVHTGRTLVGNGIAEMEYVTFHKLTLVENGTLEYKGQYDSFDPRLWPQVKLLVELLTETPAEKILFKANEKTEDTSE